MNQTAIEIMPGAEVFSADGERLGTVKEVEGEFFKVDARMQPDYWLSCNHVSTCDPQSVNMTFTKERLGDKRYGNPNGY